MIPLDEPVVGDREIEYLTACIRSGRLSWQGRYVGEFERNAAAYTGVRHAVSTNSGTGALIVALQALGIGPGDEVIVPTLTFSASIWAVTAVGATPVFADSLQGSWGVDPADVERRVTPRTRALLVVHLYGHAVEMDAVMAIARAARLRVVEDVAQAFGGDYKGRKLGSFGDVGCVSFHNKLIATGEGGMIITDDSGLARRVGVLRNPAPDNRTDFAEPSLNYRMSNITAAVGLAQLERLEEIIARKRALAREYDAAFEGSAIDAIAEPAECRSVYWRYAALVSPRARVGRAALVDALATRDICARASFQPMHLHPTCKAATPGGFPRAERLGSMGIDLPSSPKLSDRDLQRVIGAVLDLSRP